MKDRNREEQRQGEKERRNECMCFYTSKYFHMFLHANPHLTVHKGANKSMLESGS